MDYYQDIGIGAGFQLTPHSSGDAMIVDGLACLLQDIRLEAVTQEGDLFYDPEYGWSLQEFCHCVADELTLLAIGQRVSAKLARRQELDVSRITASAITQDDSILVQAAFALRGSSKTYTMDLAIGRVQIEVIRLD